MSAISTVPSLLPNAIHFPSGEHASDFTPSADFQLDAISPDGSRHTATDPPRISPATNPLFPHTETTTIFPVVENVESFRTSCA
jgi:hypothetical protein